VGLYVMDLDKELEVEHLLFFERKCRVCGRVKNLIEDFYLTRKNKSSFPSAYSYECKECTVRRVSKSRKKLPRKVEWEYPDW
jgi:ribosomal protein L33